MKLRRAGRVMSCGCGVRTRDSESIGAPEVKGTGVRRRIMKKRHWAVEREANWARRIVERVMVVGMFRCRPINCKLASIQTSSPHIWSCVGREDIPSTPTKTLQTTNPTKL